MSEVRGRLWFIRWWWQNPICNFIGYWRYRFPGWWAGKPEFMLRTVPHCNPICYCPEGSVTELRVAALGCGVWFHWGRDWVKRPCVCQQVVEAFCEES